MKKIFALLLFFIALINCKIYAYSGDIKLVPTTSIVLNEDSQILRGVFSAAISANEDRIVLIDKSMTRIFQYNINSGELLNFYLSDDSLNSIVRNKLEYLKKPSVSSYKFIPNDSVEKIGLNRKMVVNDFFDISYTANGRILVGGFVRWFSVDTINLNKKPLLQNMTCFYFFDDSLNIIYSSPFETYRTEWPNATSLIIYKDSGIVTSVQNFDDDNPELTAFSLFGFDGKHKRLMSYLPEDYAQRAYGYYLFNNILSCKVGCRYFWTSEMDYKIRELTSGNCFEIVGLDTTNKFSWLEYDKLLKRKQEIEESGSDENIKLVLNLKATIGELANWNDSLIAINVDRNGEYVQFYNLEGRLKASFQLVPLGNQTIEKVLFAPKSMKIIAISKDDENYYLCNYNIEMAK
jgi:hypothetical protein